ncbi:MAG: hypothetical protein KAG98_02475, partial [Lentisphaeria bacterium]|nr:hypothetical protein [Lentisphaeria bacterium]
MPNQKATNQFSSTFASLSKICQDILVKTSVMGKTWNISDAYSWYNMVKVNKSPVSLPKLNTHLKSIQDAEIIKLTAVKVSMSDNWYFFLLNQALESGFLTNEKSLITSRFSPVISSGYFRQEISLASLSREMIVNYSSSKSKKLLKTLNIDKKRFSDEDYMTVKTEVFNFFCFNNKLDTLMTEDSKKSCLLDELMVALCDDIQECTADIVNKIHTWLVAKPELDNRYNDIVSNLLYYYLISGKQQEADQLLALTSDSVRDLFAIVNSLFFDKVCDLDELLQTYYKSIIHWKATATPKVINYLQVFFYLGMLIPKKNLFGSAQLLKLIPTSTQAKLSPAVLGTLKELVKRNSGEIVNSSKNFVAKIRTESITTQFLQDVGACLIHRHTADCNPEFVYDHSISSDIKVMNDLSLGIFSNEYQFLIKNTKEFLASLENVGLISRVERTPEWLFMLEGLEKVYLPHKKRDGENAVGKERLIWIIDEHSHSSGITCKKQKINNHGKWSNGTAVSAKSLRDGKHDAAANDQDFTIIQCMECSWGSNWTFNRESALLKMSGAQNLYKKVGYNDQLAIQIIEDKQTLQIQHKDDGYFLSLNHWSCYPGTKLKKESEQAYKVVRIEDKEVKLSRLIPQKGRLIPEEGKALLLELAPEMAKKVRVDSNLEEIQGASLEIEASSEITIRLYPLKGGVKVESIIGPFGKQKRTFHPGKGTARFFETSLNDEQVIFIRDLEKEKASYSELMELCPIIAAEDDGDFSCFIEGVEDALELISELYAIKDKFNTEWPEGEHLLFAGNVDMDNLQLRIKSENSWFELEGDVIVSETEKLKAKDLLMPDKRHGRFIQLSDGRFLAMTKSLHKKLEVAKSFVNVDRNAMKLHPTAAWGFNEFAESV